LYGIAGTKRDLFPGARTPWGRSVRWVRQRFGHDEEHVLAMAGSASGAGSGFGAFLPGTPSEPDAGSAAAPRAAVSRALVGNVDERRQHDTKRLTEGIGKVAKDLLTERSERVADVAQLQQRVATAVGGEGGSA